jgi:hypothetical protein
MKVTKALCLGGHLYLINNHSIPYMKKIKFDLINHISKDGINSNMTSYLSNSDIRRFPEKDLAIIRLSKSPPGKKVIDYFGSNDISLKTNGHYIKRLEDGSVNYLPVKKLVKERNVTISALSLVTDIWKGVVTVPTRYGDCGSTLIVQSEMGPFIGALHVIGKDDLVGSLSIDRLWLNAVVYKIEPFMVQSGHPRLSAANYPRDLTLLHPKSPLRYIEAGQGLVYGSFTGYRPGGKSRVCNTIANEFLSLRGYKVKYGPPVMKGYMPYRIALLDSVEVAHTIDSDILKICEESFTHDILSKLSEKSLNDIMVYDTFTAVNGAAGVAYVDKMNRNTSMGNPWKKSKKYFIKNITPQHDLQDPVEFNDEILERVDDIISRYKDGETVEPNFCAHLKDEAVSFKKQKMQKTRVFTGAPADWSIVVRKYCLSFIRVLQNNKFIFEAAPGTNCHSSDWTEIYNFLTKHGVDNIVAGDYKSFDKRMPAEIILSAFNIIMNICKASGNYSHEDLLVVRGIAEDVAFPLIDYNGDLIKLFGSNPSGHPLTVIINSLVNSLYIRYCYLILNPKQEVRSFQANVNLMTYGDDNIMGVSKTIPWFNHTNIVEALASFGIVYTMADKEAESIPYINIKDASFLKRTWVYSPVLENYLCPLDHDSIEKMLMVWVKSKSICAEEQMCAIISSAIREYFFYGKDIFNEKRALFMEYIEHAQISFWIENVPEWEQLVNEFKENNLRKLKH